MENGYEKPDGEDYCGSSALLELLASDDLVAFRRELEEKGFDIDQPSFWYGRRIGSKKMGIEERTPLMIAAMFGSVKIVKHIVGTGTVDVNRTCGSDRVTALHCATTGSSVYSIEIVKLLLDASADPNCVNANGIKPVDLIGPALISQFVSRKKALEILLQGDDRIADLASPLMKEGAEKKEYPVDVSLPDINNGIYGTDEFRMYTFKVQPCSRAYTHDWTECPFVHPGENARRRDPRKYPYTCVPCPEFRKGTCQKGDSCEYAHGVFESWLHPAQYRTRLCKDEIGCPRKVCFFAHKPEELRPVYASTGSAMPSPRSPSSISFPSVSTPPMSPSVAVSSTMNTSLWQNKAGLTPPALQLQGSRLKAAFNARDFDLEMELLGLENRTSRQQQYQQLMDEISYLSSPTYQNNDYSRIGELKPRSNLGDSFGSLDSSMFSQSQSSTGHQIDQNMNLLRSSYTTKPSSSPVRKQSSVGLNSRSAAFAQRSQSFIDRTTIPHHQGLTASTNSASLMPSRISDWSSPDSKLNWGIQGDDLNKLKKSASFGFQDMGTTAFTPSVIDEPDVSWVHSLVKDIPSENSRSFGAKKPQYNKLSRGMNERLPPWLEQLYIEGEQIVA